MREPRATAGNIGASGRRNLIWGSAALLAGTAALAARPGRAFSIVDADARTQAAFHDACGAVQMHTDLVAEAQAELTRRGMAPAEIDAALPIACPTCGCRLALAGGAVNGAPGAER